MKALIIKGTTFGGKAVCKGEVVEMTERQFRLFELRGQAARAEAPKPEPVARPAQAPEPKKTHRKKGSK